MATLKEDIVNELYKPMRKKFLRRRTIIKGIDDLWQADIIDMQLYSKENRGYKYILCVICAFSKYLWLVPLKNKSAKIVAEAMQYVLNNSNHRIPKNLQTHLGKEFYNQLFANLLKKYGINHYSSYTIIKCAIAERVIRTIKQNIYKMFGLQGHYKWINELNNITHKYNNTVHRTINMKPIDVKKKHEKRLLSTVYSHIKLATHKKFQVGDIVRISKQKTIFEKGYTPNWTTELFKIFRIKFGYPTVYILKDFNDSEIKGAFYAEELQKVKHNNAYLVEKILKRKGNKVFVKWLGFSNKDNSWVSKADIA